MNSKQRVYAALQYKGFDRPPAKHYGTPEINKELMNYFSMSTYEQLQLKVGDDFRHIAPKYIGPESKTFEDGSWEGLWGERYTNYSFGSGTYPEAIYLPFKNVTDVGELNDFRMPSPDWFDYSNIKEDCEKYKDYCIYAGDAGTPDFINGIARCRGVEQVLFDIGLEDPVYLTLMEQRFKFFYQMYSRVLEAGEGLIDIMCFGEDLGNQNGLMISPKIFNKLFASYFEKLFALAHKYGAKTMMHCCGSCRDLIPELIELGLDILEVVQVDAANMDIRDLHRDFYGKIAFCGSISVQNTLPFGTKEEIVREVELRKQLFRDGGMIIGPTHDIQVGTPLENIIDMYRTIGSLNE
jgi:uroporphyrinogen decarboxylase